MNAVATKCDPRHHVVKETKTKTKSCAVCSRQKCEKPESHAAVTSGDPSGVHSTDKPQKPAKTKHHYWYGCFKKSLDF